MKNLGKVRPEHIKKAARQLIELYPHKFNMDFQSNKQAVESLAQISSHKLRNRVAGYITNLISIQRSNNEELDEEESINE